MIQYTTGTTPNVTAVRLDGKLVGVIRAVENGFRYEPKGSKNFGDVFPTLAECKKSLESE